jgi:hypothetical protein
MRVEYSNLTILKFNNSRPIPCGYRYLTKTPYKDFQQGIQRYSTQVIRRNSTHEDASEVITMHRDCKGKEI